jgi:Mg2+ and Co2+ transporter CorA
MSRLVEELRQQIALSEYSGTVRLDLSEARELLAHIERLEAQLAEAKILFLTERTERVPHEEQQEEWDDSEEYFDRMIEQAAKQRPSHET